MKRGLALALVFLALLSLIPLPSIAQMLDAKEQQIDPVRKSVTLYFRYQDSALLGREEREITFPRTMAPELAIASALVEGPGSLSPWLNPLFPPGTQVLSSVSEDGRLFLTFNEALTHRYSDEALVMSADYRRGEGQLRRRLAMASLVNTLTETGEYSSVQVLVRGETYVAASMRLSQRYYLEEGDSLPPPLLRQEEYILTPQAAMLMFMEAWQTGNWHKGLRLIRGDLNDPIPPEHELRALAEKAPRLISYAVSPGVVSLDGQSAVVCVDYSVLGPDNNEKVMDRVPVTVDLRDGQCALPYDGTLHLMGVSP